jgi:large subunit ribosomal protein L10
VALTLEQKKTIVAEVASVASGAQSAIAADYRGVTVKQIDDLRAKARAEAVYLRVVKNTLARRALEGTGFACMRDSLSGPVMFAFSLEDPGAGARLLRDFAKANERLVVKAVCVGGRLLEPSALERLAKLPTRDQALSMLMGVMKAPIEKLVRTLAAVRDQKQAA